MPMPPMIRSGNITKEMAWEHILSCAGLNSEGLCKECNFIDDECGCFAGLVRYWMAQVKENT